ncbi:hypothetical protein BDZ89DRAFT_1227777 [Hymenopellis radicata]|nr:hypothetical protein BDZ89DRAFT_1227777 [Hymenopellis radicata]
MTKIAEEQRMQSWVTARTDGTYLHARDGCQLPRVSINGLEMSSIPASQLFQTTDSVVKIVKLTALRSSVTPLRTKRNTVINNYRHGPTATQGLVYTAVTALYTSYTATATRPHVHLHGKILCPLFPCDTGLFPVWNALRYLSASDSQVAWLHPHAFIVRLW